MDPGDVEVDEDATRSMEPIGALTPAPAAPPSSISSHASGSGKLQLRINFDIAKIKGWLAGEPPVSLRANWVEMCKEADFLVKHHYIRGTTRTPGIIDHRLNHGTAK
jgi:hypothetical protein